MAEPIDPGKAYPVSAWGTGDFSLKRVDYRVDDESAVGMLHFERPKGLGDKFSEVESGQKEVRDAV